LDDVVVELLDGDVRFTRSQYGIEQSQEAHPHVAWAYSADGSRCGLSLGDAAKWRIEAVKTYVEKDELTLRVAAKKDSDMWTVLVPVEVPESMKPPPRVYSL
jgi:hypothetical protein